jgi:hypothetical protein
MWTFRVAFLGLFSSCSYCISLLSKVYHRMLSRRDTFDRDWSQWWMSSNVLLSSGKFTERHHPWSTAITLFARRNQVLPSPQTGGFTHRHWPLVTTEQACCNVDIEWSWSTQYETWIIITLDTDQVDHIWEEFGSNSLFQRILQYDGIDSN